MILNVLEMPKTEIDAMIVKLTNSRRQEPACAKSYACRFIEPGLVSYNAYGTILVQKPALDKMAQSFVGKPVINEVHRADVKLSDFKDGMADGVVSRVWFNQADGWYWCDFIVWDAPTMRNCENTGYSVSCAYSVKGTPGPAGVHNNIEYTQEVTDGEYTHLSIVSSPRYEGARIVYNSVIFNSKGGSKMGWKFWQKEGRTELTNMNEDVIVEVDGKSVSIKTLVEAYNTKSATLEVIDIEGKQIPVKDVVAGYVAHLKNEKDEDDKKKKDKEDMENSHKSGTHKANRLDNCTLCNSEKDEEDKEKKKKDMENKAEADKKFKELQNAAGTRGEAVVPVVKSRQDKIQEGRTRYGSSASK